MELNAEPLAKLSAQLTASHGVEIRSLPMNLADGDAVKQIRAISDDLDVGLLVFNAGGAHGTKPFLDYTYAQALATVQLNPVTLVALSHHLAASMTRRGSGGILLVGSLAGSAGGANVVLYSAIKSFAQTFAEGLWSEMQPHGVDVLYLVLGAVDTPARSREGIVDSAAMPVADPNDIAQLGLANLPNGPVCVPDYLVPAFEQLSAMPRREAAKMMSDMLRMSLPS